MPSGLPNTEKAADPPALCRGQGDARASCSRPKSAATTVPGTCTFYGTANSNQMLMEIMGLHLPGAAFVNPEHAAARCADRARRRSAPRAEHALWARTTCRLARRHRRARDRQRASSACWPPAARPTTRFTWWRWRALPASDQLGRLQRPVGRRAAARAHLSERQRPT